MHFALKGGTLLFVIKRTNIPALICSLLTAPLSAAGGTAKNHPPERSHPMTQVRAPDIATKEEVLETFTQLMRGEKTAEQMKAADALAKYHGLFAGKEDEAPRRPPEVAQAIDDAIAALSGKKRKSRKEVKPNE